MMIMYQNSFFNILSFTDVESKGMLATNYIEEVHGLHIKKPQLVKVEV
jgi:hypothetical protein